MVVARLLFAILALGVAAAAQQAPLNKPETERVNPWLERAKLVTAEIDEDAYHLTWDQRALLSARLAEAWSKSDPKRAHDLLAEAVESVTSIPRNESDEHRKQRTEAARLVCDVAAPLDRQLADKVMASLTKGLDEPTVRNMKNAGQRMRVGNSLANGAEKIMHDDPPRTVDLIRRMIQLGDGNDLQRLIPFLRVDNPALGDQIVLEAVASARTDYDSNLLFGLTQVLFPRYPRPAPYNAPFSQEIQDAVLQLVAEGMLRVPQSDDDKKQICYLALTAAQLLPHYPPQRMGALQAAISSCSSGPSVDAELKASSLNLKSSDDFYKAATSETEAAKRADYKMHAANLADQDKNPLRALEIMESFTSEERDARPGWSNRVTWYATRAIEERYRQHDTAGIQALLERVPDEERPMALLSVAQMAISQGDAAFGTLYIVAARRALEKTDPSTPVVFSMLLSAYARTLPTELPQVFPFYVAGLNRFRPKDPKTDKPVLNSPWTQLRPLGVPKQVLELDEAFVRGSIDALDQATLRESFRLGVLQASLRLYADSQKPPEPEKLKAEPTKLTPDCKQPAVATPQKPQ